MENKIYFYKSNEPYGFLNNFKKSRMFIFNNWWNNVEAPYQAMKCLKSEDFKSILNSATPREARDLGQKVQMIPYWDEVKLDIMQQCIIAKFTQNHEFLKLLLETGDSELVEDSPVDSFWGCGKDKNGLNHLGKILMKVREMLKDF